MSMATLATSARIQHQPESWMKNTWSRHTVRASLLKLAGRVVTGDGWMISRKGGYRLGVAKYKVAKESPLVCNSQQAGCD